MDLGLLLLFVQEEGEGAEEDVGDEVEDDVDDEAGQVAAAVDALHARQVASQKYRGQACAWVLIYESGNKSKRMHKNTCAP